MARFFRDGTRVPSLAGHGHGCLSVALVGVQVLVAFWLASTILHSWSLHVPVAPRATGYAARSPAGFTFPSGTLSRLSPGTGNRPIPGENRQKPDGMALQIQKTGTRFSRPGTGVV